MNAQYNSTAASPRERVLIEKIRMLSPDRLAEVQDFVEFLSQRDQDARLLRAGNKLSEEAFNKVWDNPEDAEYDNL
jgi:hypothetical protein